MQALEIDSSLQCNIKHVPRPELRPGQALVKVEAAAWNRRDWWIGKDRYHIKRRLPCILGSDCCGVVKEVANESDRDWVNKEVIINPGFEWGSKQHVQSEQFHILGMPENGTFAEYVAVDARYLYAKPPHLTVEQAAALPLAGVTAYRAVAYKAQVSKDDLVLVTGIGGGVAQFALQFCVALGAKVYVTSGSKDKIERAKSLGASDGVLYSIPDWDKELEGKLAESRFDVVIDGVGGPGFEKLVNLLKPGGILVNYGATAGASKGFDISKLFLDQLKLVGSTMGSPKDFEDMLHLVNEKKLVPVVDSIHPFGDILSALEKMDQAKQFGKLVVKMTSTQSQ